MNQPTPVASVSAINKSSISSSSPTKSPSLETKNNERKNRLDTKDKPSESLDASIKAFDNSMVYYKIIAFSIAMISLPLAIFFITKKYLFFGDEVYSAIMAVLTANLLIVVYVIMAIMEDRKFEKEKIKSQ